MSWNGNRGYTKLSATGTFYLSAHERMDGWMVVEEVKRGGLGNNQRESFLLSVKLGHETESGPIRLR
jgi:hypothetical protein